MSQSSLAQERPIDQEAGEKPEESLRSKRRARPIIVDMEHIMSDALGDGWAGQK
jgi:hypothetical protein